MGARYQVNLQQPHTSNPRALFQVSPPERRNHEADADSHRSQRWIPPRSQSSLLRSPVSWAVPVPVEVLPKSELSSWTTPPEALSATSRAQSAKTTSYACSSPNVRHAD